MYIGKEIEKERSRREKPYLSPFKLRT